MNGMRRAVLSARLTSNKPRNARGPLDLHDVRVGKRAVPHGNCASSVLGVELGMSARQNLAVLVFGGSWLIAGCGSDEPLPGNVQLDAACASLIDECRVDQMTCRIAGGVPRCTPCSPGQYVDEDGLCKALTGESWLHDFPELTTAGLEEILDVCRSWTLNNPTELWVNAVELEQNEASHHSNWMFAPQDRYPGPDGLWPCRERGYDQLSAALSGGVLYAQSTQAAREVQKFPDGVAIRIPPYSTVLSAVHTLNTSRESVTGHIRLKIFTVPAQEVKVKLAPFHLSYDELDIPAHSRARFSGTCELDSKYVAAGRTGFDAQIYWILPHTHALGRRFFLELVGGPNDGQKLIDVQGFNGEARGRTYRPPVDVRGATGLRFGCEFDNPRDENVVWGFGDQEMCECLGFADSAIGFESRISTVEPEGSEGDLLSFTGACNTAAFPWDQNKAGGAP
jgi:hypothetical protein